MVVRVLLKSGVPHLVLNEDGSPLHDVDCLVKSRVEQRLVLPLHALLCQLSSATRAREIIANTLRLDVQRLLQEHDIPTALRARVDLAPDGVLDASDSP